MTALEKLSLALNEVGTYLCVGIDLHREYIKRFAGNTQALQRWVGELIECAIPYCAAFKFNTAFYEALGVSGWELLMKMIRAVPSTRLTVLDSKRGDLASTASAYAYASFEVFGADAVTVNPYMGCDAIEPFARYDNHLTFVLALTSNPGSQQFQQLPCNGQPLFCHVVEVFHSWQWHRSTGFVVGATRTLELATIRSMVGPNTPLLLPGIGAQNANVREVLSANAEGMALMNVSRDLLNRYYEGGIFALESGLEYYRTLLKLR